MLAKVLEPLRSEIQESFRKATQSSKTRAKQISDRVKQVEEYLQNSTGVSLDQAAKEKLHKQIEQEMDQAEEQPEGTEQVSPQDDIALQVYNETQAIYTAEKMALTQKDPEWSSVNDVLNDPNGNIHLYRKALYHAIDSKRRRLGQKKATASARVGGDGSTPPSNDISKITDTAQLYMMGDRQMRSGKK